MKSIKLFKKPFAIILSLALIICAVPMRAVTVNAAACGDWEYIVLSGDTAEIKAYKGSGGDVTIPSTIDDYTITGIGSYAFFDCDSLKSITIPNSVTSIGDDAFRSCNGLTSVIIPDSVTSIGAYAFSWCSGLTNITIPDSITGIGDHAFFNCGSLQYNQYDNAKYLGNDENPYVALISSKSTDITSCEISDSAKIIYDYAFSDCDRLTSISIPNGVICIGDCAFISCRSLTSITIPNSVTSIGNAAFSYCFDLTSIAIPTSITSISDHAFFFCYALTSITIPTSVTSIGNYAFSTCSGLTSITIPNSVTSIGDYAFFNCDSLTSITIPDSVTSIGDDVFRWCIGLTSVTLTNGVTSIGDYAFYNCDSLTSITIPDSVTTMSASAFTGCNNLTVYGYEGSYAQSVAKSCGIPFVVIEKPHEHNYVANITPPTCTNQGYTTYVCSVCDDTYIDDFVSATGHLHAEIRGAYNANYTSEGYTGDTYCTDCGELLSTGTVIPPLERINGDINLDGVIDLRDLISIKKIIASGSYNRATDFSGNGNNDALDLLMLKKYLLGELTELPCDAHFGDINDDGEVNNDDITDMITAIFSDVYSFGYDLNGDGKLNYSDLNIIMTIVDL